MARIKSLAVAVLHAVIHTVRLHDAEQIPGESCKAFAARVRGIASNCVLNKKCDCGKDVSYLEETVYNVVLAGLRDKEMQEACTIQALLGNIKDIATLVEFCTAKESGQLCSSGVVGGLRKRSAYQNQRFKRDANKSSTLVQPCTFCGPDKGHSGSSRVIGEKECKAYAMTFSKCKRKGHYTNLCKSRPKPKNNAYY